MPVPDYQSRAGLTRFRGGIQPASLPVVRAKRKDWTYDRLGGKPAITAVVDDFIGNVAADARINQRCAVVGQGGYGRGELNPSSDIDLLFLYPWKVNPFVETVGEVILYGLWDGGLVVGHALRNIRECGRLAQRDMKVKTALLDARYLAGDEALYAEF